MSLGRLPDLPAGKGVRAWLAVAGLGAILLQGCGALERREAVPPGSTEAAVTPGAPDSRYWVDPQGSPHIELMGA